MVTDPAGVVVVLGKKAEVEIDGLGEAVPLLPSSDEEGTNVVPLEVESVPLLPSSDEEGRKVADAPVPVGPTTTELALKVGKGAP